MAICWWSVQTNLRELVDQKGNRETEVDEGLGRLYRTGFSSVLTSSEASSLLNLSDHFLSSSSILSSAEDLTDLLSETDLVGLSVDNLASFAATLVVCSDGQNHFLLSFLLALEPGDCNIWLSTAPTTDTNTGPTGRNCQCP